MGDRTGTVQGQAPTRGPRRQPRGGIVMSGAQRDAFLLSLQITPPVPQTQNGPQVQGAPGTPGNPLPPLPATPPTATAQPATAATATAPAQPVSMTPTWTGGVTVKKGLKGDAKKKTCIIEIGGQEYILKGAPRLGNNVDFNNRDTRSTTEDNAEAAKLIRDLGLKGVRAPQIRLVKDNERTQVLTALQAVVTAGGPSARDASELIDSFKNGDVQLSERDPGGVDPDRIFLDVEIDRISKEGLSALRTHQNDREAGWQELLKSALPTWEFKNNADVKADDWPTRKRGLAAISIMNPEVAEYVRYLTDFVDDAQAQGLARAESENTERVQNQAKLKAFAASPEGVTAYAGVAVADLVTGMNDRILGAWNGGNMLFDANTNEFACVDNNKAPDQGLTEPGSREWSIINLQKLANSRSGSLVDVIYDSIYTKGTDNEPLSEAPDRPANMPGLTMTEDQAKEAKTIILDTLNDVFAKIESNAGANPVALERVAAMKELMQLQNLLNPPPSPALMFAGAVEEPSTTDKIGRGLRSLGSDWFSDADKIKSMLRKNPTGYQKARTDLDALIKRHPKDSKGGADRLAQHINFLATACEFAELLGGKAAALGSMVDATDFPADTHGKPTFDRLAKPFEEQAALWGDNLRSSDGAITATVQAGRASFDRACTTARAKYT